MYIIPVEIKQSSIDGKGVFAKNTIQKDAIVWQYTEGHDKRMSAQAFDEQDSATKEALERTAYLSPTSGVWVIPPEDDPACYTNHSSHPNTTVVIDHTISDEPLFIANRDIQAGEEITNNYLEFDENTKPESSSWL